MTPELCLYHLTLQKSGAITTAVFGNFSAPRAQEIVVARGKILELLRPDDESGKVQSVLSVECFGVVRAIHPFRLVDGKTDYLLVGSDSGRINILEYDAKKNRWKKIHEETFGKSGCRRIVPGQYLACDPKGRACMIGAVEKQKLVYILNRDSEANLTISSPLEAHKSHSVNFAICGVDVGFENPVFAVLELDYESAVEEKERKGVLAKPKKMLTYYELDLGLNHVTRKWADTAEDGASLLLTVPGGTDGPGGVLVCCENCIVYRDPESKIVKTPLPRRFGTPDDKPIMIISAATHVQKNLFFFLVQSELGDLYKVTLVWEEDAGVTDMKIKYFDTINPCTSLCLLKTGFLFCASEFGNHYLFQFQGIGDDDQSSETTSSLGDQAGAIYFQPRKLTNLASIDEMESLAPIIDMKIADLCKESTPQIYSLCGRGPRSTLRVLRHGLAVTEMAVSELPGNPNAVWAVKKNLSDEYNSYIVVSFVNATIVLAIGETVVEVSDSGVLDSTPTLSMSTLADGSLLQIHTHGIRHIRPSKRINEWKTPGKKEITQCAVNERQVVVGLSGGELVYFELDKMNSLMDVHRKEMGNDVSSLCIGPIPEGRRRSQFMVVGSYDNTVRVLSLDPTNPLAQLTLQAFEVLPKSLRLVAMEQTSLEAHTSALYLYVGLANGVLVRSYFDEADGSLRDSRKRFLGTRPVKLFQVQIQKRPAVLAISSRTWLSHTHQNRFQMAPLSYEVLEYASAFASEQCPEGIVSVSTNTLRIVTLERLGEMFNQTTYPLRYTPRHFVVNEENNHMIIIESDQNAYPWKVMKEMQRELKAMEDDDEGKTKVKKEEGKEEEPDENEPSEVFVGRPEAGIGKWASCIRIFDPVAGETTYLEELEDNEAAFSVSTCRLISRDNQLFLAVGTAKDLTLTPRRFSAGYIRLYRFTDRGKKLELIHRTELKDIPQALCAFKGRLLAGLGSKVLLYEVGKKKLLRKSENKNFPTSIQSIQAQGDRIFVGDVCEAFSFVQHRKRDKSLTIFADTTAPRFVTAQCLIDFDTICGGDKFGNVWISRLPADVSARIAKDPTGGALRGAYGELIKVEPHKLNDIMQFHVGELVTSLQKCSLVPGFNEVIVYSTIHGAIGIFLPFTTRESVEFFSHLEMHMRQENQPLCGRDHLAFRSYYYPVKDCIDGDLCEQYTTLPVDVQKKIADELVSTPSEVAKKLEELRNRVM